jgi:hypothetical protein
LGWVVARSADRSSRDATRQLHGSVCKVAHRQAQLQVIWAIDLDDGVADHRRYCSAGSLRMKQEHPSAAVVVLVL